LNVLAHLEGVGQRQASDATADDHDAEWVRIGHDALVGEFESLFSVDVMQFDSFAQVISLRERLREGQWKLEM
jgi:hypothetical protein